MISGPNVKTGVQHQLKTLFFCPSLCFFAFNSGVLMKQVTSPIINSRLFTGGGVKIWQQAVSAGGERKQSYGGLVLMPVWQFVCVSAPVLRSKYNRANIKQKTRKHTWTSVCLFSCPPPTPPPKHLEIITTLWGPKQLMCPNHKILWRRLGFNSVK